MPEQWIGHALTALAMIGSLAGVYTKISARLTRIETCMEIEQAAKPDRVEARKAVAHQIAREEVREHESMCPAREPTGVRAMPVER